TRRDARRAAGTLELEERLEEPIGGRLQLAGGRVERAEPRAVWTRRRDDVPAARPDVDALRGRPGARSDRDARWGGVVVVRSSPRRRRERASAHLVLVLGEPVAAIAVDVDDDE